MALIMNTTEIESAIIHFEANHPDLCQRIELPEKSCEGRTCHALRVAKRYSTHNPAVLIIGGVHAREWGGPDIVINFAGDILKAYASGKGLKYLNKTFPADDIRTIVENKTIVVFPCVNPDGVEFSHTKTHLWRKNRNRSYSHGNAKNIGVDINRNYDFLWNFKKFFHPAAWTGNLASDQPSVDTFHGPAPFSEPETRNVKWLMDNHNFSLFLDLHSYAGDVLYSWGDDEDQTTDPSQNFGNPAFDGKRGRVGDAYREYLSSADFETAVGIAQTVSDAMRAVRNRPYKPVQAVGLYPTSGTSDDYAFSRHIVNPSLAKTFGFTLEFNFTGDAGDPFFATADPGTLDKTMRDVIPGLIAFCLGEPPNTRAPTQHATARSVSTYASFVDPYHTAPANEIFRLIGAYDMLASVQGAGGETARRGVLEAIQEIASAARKSRKIRRRSHAN